MPLGAILPCTDMDEFFTAFLDPDFPFLRNAVVGGVLASVPLGVTGSFVVVRRISYLAGAIAHCVLLGIGAALYGQARFGWSLSPMMGAAISALSAALLVGAVSIYAHEREDTVIGAIWALGVSGGIVLFAKTPGYLDPMSYLFGNILLTSQSDLWLAGILTVTVILVLLTQYKHFVAVCFDEEFARLRGIPTTGVYVALLCLTAITVVLMVSLVGIVLVIALITLPPAIASHFSKRVWEMMVGAVVLSNVFILGGIAISYERDLPTGPAIVLLAGSVYLVVVIGSQLWKRQAH